MIETGRQRQCQCLTQNCRTDFSSVTMMSQWVGVEAVRVGSLLTVDVMVLFACYKSVVLGYEVIDGM